MLWLASAIRRLRPARLLFFLAVAANLAYSIPREAKLALQAKTEPPLPEIRADAELIRACVPPGSSLLVRLPDLSLRDRKYLETGLNYQIAPIRPDYAVGERKLAHDYRHVDRETPGYYDPLQFFRPLGDTPYEYILVCRGAPDLPGYELLGMNGHGAIYRRKR